MDIRDLFMKKGIKKYLPAKQDLKKMKELKILKYCRTSFSFWNFDCQSVARGIAAGLGAAVIPGFQIFYALILVILLRGNIPIALAATLITNPLTVVPIMFCICYIGSLIIRNGGNDCIIHTFNWDISSFQTFWSNLSDWALQFGKAFLMGVPIVSITLMVLGYFGTIIIWKLWIFVFHTKKK